MTKQNKKQLSGFIACIITLALLTGLVFSALEWWTDKGPSTWGKKEETEKEQVDAGGGGIMAPVEDSVEAMGLSVTKLAREEYGDYGIMPIADTAFTIKASYTDTAVTYKELDWTIKWKSGASGQWGDGKTVTEYATISPSQDTLTLTLTVKKAFGEQIIITATNRLNPECTKSATLDYAKRVTNVSWTFVGKGGTTTEGSSQYKFPGVVSGDKTAKMTTVTPKYTYSDTYSVDDTFEVTSLKIRVKQDFLTNLKSAIAGSSVYSGDAKKVIDSIDMAQFGTNQSFTEVWGSVPDISVFQVLWSEITRDTTFAYTSSTALDNSLKQLLALYMKKGSDAAYCPIFDMLYTVTGTHSTYSVNSSTMGLGFNQNAFDTAAAAGSLKFDNAAFVA